MRIAAVIVAAGRGLRAGTGVPKQFRPLAGRPVLAHSVGAFAAHRAVAELVVVAHPDDAERAAAACGVAAPHRVAGGATRAASVAAGLAALGPGITHVLIHDAARPCVPAALIDRVVAGLATSTGAAPALPVSDALWQARGGSVLAAHPRAGLFAAQTPQGFELAAIRAAHAAHPGGAADDVEVALAHGLDVALVAGEPDALKITRPDDFARAERALGGGGMDIRTGTGIDVHAFGEGDHVTLCGVDIPHDRGLVGHSDADVAMHALTDALYGALAEGDIGRHFPPTDPQWRHAASHVFLDHAASRAAARGYRLASADITLICEAPKIAPHTDAMTATLARCTGAGAGRIAVKATTSEGLGFPGRGEGIAALATVTLLAP